MNLLKASSVLERDRPIWRRTRLIAGVILAIGFNSALDMVAFGLCPLALIAPIGGLAIVSSVLLARLGCAGRREVVTGVQWAAIWSVVIGVAIVDIYGPRPDPVLDTAHVLALYHGYSFMMYRAALLCAIAATYTGLYLGKIGGPTLETVVATAITGGMCSGTCQTMMKLIATCIAAFTLTGELPFEYVEFYLAIVELIIFALVLLHCLNMCIASAALALSTPLYQVCVILFTIVAASSFFGDLDVVTRFELLMFSLGVSAVLCGLMVLVLKRDTSHDERPVATQEPKKDQAAAPCAQATMADVLVDDPDPEL